MYLDVASPNCPRFGGPNNLNMDDYIATGLFQADTQPGDQGGSTGRKDPHFRFGHGDRADIRGEHGAIYNLLSAKNVSNVSAMASVTCTTLSARMRTEPTPFTTKLAIFETGWM